MDGIPCACDCFYQRGGYCEWDILKKQQTAIDTIYFEKCPYFVPKSDGFYLPPRQEIRGFSVFA